MSVVRVQIIQDGEWRTVAQLDEPLAKVYIDNLVSDHYSEQLLLAGVNTKSRTIQERIYEFYDALQSAIFSDFIRMVPPWVPDQPDPYTSTLAAE